MPIPWHKWLQAQILRYEAEALIGGRPHTDDPKALVARARAHVRVQQWDKAIADFSRAIDLEAADPGLWAERARCCVQLKQWDKAVADLSKALVSQPEKARLWIERGRCFRELKQGDKVAADFASAADRLARELPTHRAIFATQPDFLLKREALAEFYRDLAEAQRLGGRPAAAAATLRRHEKLWPGHAGWLFNTAKQLTLIIPAIGKDPTNLTDEEQAQRRRVADQAMALVEQAVRAGYQDAGSLKKDADLEPLRRRKDFKALVAEMERDNDFPAPTGEISRWSGHQTNSWVWSVAVSADGRRALSGGTDKAVCLWDVARGKLLRRLGGISQSVYAVAISPDGRRALSASGENTIPLWDLENGKVIRRFTGHTGWVGTVCFLANGRGDIARRDQGADRQLRQDGAALEPEDRQGNPSLRGASKPGLRGGLFTRRPAGAVRLRRCLDSLVGP
jgi:tetratricopeptide (TPR) repeat protein